MLRSISSAISAQESIDTHEAASSMPSGMPSTSRQMRSACRRSSSSRAKPGLACVARSTNSRSAPPPPPVLREAEAVDVEHPLALHVETFSRRRQELDVRGALDHLAEQAGAVDQVLEVVEHEQRRALAEIVEQLLLRREAAQGELDRLGDGGREKLRRRHGGERDEVDAVRVAVDPARGGLEREPRLAGSARPDERQQAAVRILEQPVDRLELRRTADERRAR